jgi:hypothetical protein
MNLPVFSWWLCRGLRRESQRRAALGILGVCDCGTVSLPVDAANRNGLARHYAARPPTKESRQQRHAFWGSAEKGGRAALLL